MITLWVIGYLFTAGVLEDDGNKGFLSNIIPVFCRFFSWPYDIGVFLRQAIEEQR